MSWLEVDRLDRSVDGKRIFLVLTCGNAKEASKVEKKLRKFLNIKRGFTTNLRK